MNDHHDHVFKLLLIGDSGVGKSCLLLRYVDDGFCENHFYTIGVDFKIQTLQIEGKTIKLQIWDLAGQDRFRTIVTSYYRDVFGFIVVYDATNMESFCSVTGWLKDVAYHEPDLRARVVLVGNKCDLPPVVDPAMACEFADSLGIPFVETSAKDSINVEDAFVAMLVRLHFTDPVQPPTMRELVQRFPSGRCPGGVKLPTPGEPISRRKAPSRCGI